MKKIYDPEGIVKDFDHYREYYKTLSTPKLLTKLYGLCRYMDRRRVDVYETNEYDYFITIVEELVRRYSI